uniref:Uncharacterized protein n=1 Tax=Desertifilum tharense IPPAS B-1220 TaxID=1781255 RepID=A0ACD5GZI7_9CYAN
MSFLGKVLLPLAIGALVVLPGCARPQASSNRQADLVFPGRRMLVPSILICMVLSQMFAQDMIFEPLVSYGRGGKFCLL